MDEDQQRFVEEFGLFMEKWALPRMMGRVWGYLLISDPPHQSAESLAKALQASRGSISMATRTLIQWGVVDKVSFPGERRDYFRIKPGVWTALFEQRTQAVSEWRKLAERGLEVIDAEDHEARRPLLEMRELFAFYERELPELQKKWREKGLKGTA